MPKCTICQNDSAPYFTSGDFTMFRCGECKLTFVSPLPDADFLQAFYSRFHSANVSAGLYAHFEERVGADFKKKAENVKAMVADPTQANVLDVGCGRGFFIQQCRVSGLSASGIDLSDTAVTYAKDVLNLEVRCGDIFDYPELKESQDVATCWATIEHVPDPIALLKKINSTLKKDGLLFIDTGIGDDWLDRLLPGVNQWYDPPQHLYVFSESALVTALEASGFRVLKIDRSFERNFPRKVARALRGLAFAVSARVLHSILRVGTGNQGVHFTRYGLGNLVSIVATKERNGQI